jgi:hypothetical protein
MGGRLTKAQVEAVMAAVDGPLPGLVRILEQVLAEPGGSEDLDAILRRHGRDRTADRIRAGDEAAAWDLAVELNERRHL